MRCYLLGDYRQVWLGGYEDFASYIDRIPEWWMLACFRCGWDM